MEKNDFPLNWFILKSQLEMRGKTNVYQITPDRVNSEFLFLWQEKKKRTAKEIKSQKKKGGGGGIYFLLSIWNRLLPLETMVSQSLKEGLDFYFFFTIKNIQSCLN